MTTLTEHSRVRFRVSGDSTAEAPPEVRGSSRDDVRMLVARRDGLQHRRFSDLADQLEPGDLVVVNNSATVNGEIDGVRRNQPVVLHAATRLEHDIWVVELRTAPDAAEPVLDAVADETIGVGELPVTLLEPYPHAGSSPTGAGNRLWRAHVEGDLRALLDRHGRPIAYGYLDRRYPLAAYQSVFSQIPGSAEMASAGRPFTHELITRLVAKGIGVAPITLHTGVSSQEAAESVRHGSDAVGDSIDHAHIGDAPQELPRAVDGGVDDGRIVKFIHVVFVVDPVVGSLEGADQGFGQTRRHHIEKIGEGDSGEASSAGDILQPMCSFALM